MVDELLEIDLAAEEWDLPGEVSDLAFADGRHALAKRARPLRRWWRWWTVFAGCAGSFFLGMSAALLVPGTQGAGMATEMQDPGWSTGSSRNATSAHSMDDAGQLDGAASKAGSGNERGAGNGEDLSANGQDTSALSDQTGAGFTPGQVVVDVHGDVRHPGVYTLGPDARVKDAVAAAGGFAHPQDADLLNLAAPLDDGAEVVVPGPPLHAGTPGLGATSVAGAGTSGQASLGGMAGAAAGRPATQQRINLNTATQATLETLPDIGPSRAAAILAYRAAHGRFQSLAELRHVHGIGPTIFARITPFLYVAAAEPVSGASQRLRAVSTARHSADAARKVAVHLAGAGS